MTSHADSLPDDIEALRAFALKMIAERDAAIAQNDRLRHLLHKANDALYGSKSERLAKLDPDQLHLALEDIEQAIAKNEAVEEKVGAPRACRKANRGALPAHLPRLHETIAPEDTNCPCCRQPMHVIGEETAERLDVIPAQYRVIVTHRPKLACRACEKIVEAPAPEHLIKAGIPTEAMVASVLVAKYGWHLPLYRQAQMLSVQGVDLDRSTLAFWVGYAAAELTPLYEELRRNLLASAKLAVDETPVPVLDPGRGKTKTGYFWAMARDDRPWGGTDPPAIVYTYAPGRGGEHLQAVARHLSRHRPVRRLCRLQEAARGPHHTRLLLGASAPPVLRPHCQGWRRSRGSRSRSPASRRRCMRSRSCDQRQERHRTQAYCAPRANQRAPGSGLARMARCAARQESRVNRRSPTPSATASIIARGLTRFLEETAVSGTRHQYCR